MKRFWIKILLLLPLPLVVIGFNWFIDPVHLRDPDAYEYGIARLVLEGKNVTNISNPNEASYLRFIVDGLPARKEVLVFGSSRSKLIRADVFPGLSFFNNSISGAGLVDYLSIYQMYRQRHLTPSIAVIELSPWLLLQNYSSIWKPLNASRQELEAQALAADRPWNQTLHFLTAAPAQFTEFLSLGYFQTSFFTWLQRTFRPSKAKRSYFEWKSHTLPMGETLMGDGSAIYPESVQNPEERERVLARAIEYGQKPIGVPEVLDPGREKVFEGFLDQLQRDGVRPVLYLPPYHPRTYALMVASERNRIIVAEQEYFETLARRKGISLVGSYNPSELSLDETAFVDGSHTTEDAVRRIFAGQVPPASIASMAPVGTAERIDLTGVSNANGVELVDGQTFFWIGKGDSYLHLRCGRDGVASLEFHASPGPSEPETAERWLLLRTEHGYSRLLHIRENPNVEISFPVDEGLNQICLTPLDKPTVSKLPNGDPRPLLVGVSGIGVTLLPAGTVPREEDLCAYNLGAGWYPIEWTGKDWLCWNSGRGAFTVMAATNMTAFLAGEILSVPRPNQVDVIVNGTEVDTLAIDWSEWAFRSFPPVRLALHTGTNTIELVSRNSAVTIAPDPRSRAVAVRNLKVSTEKLMATTDIPGLQSQRKVSQTP